MDITAEYPKITNPDMSATSVFASLDSENAEDKTNKGLAEAFTSLVRNRFIDAWRMYGLDDTYPVVEYVHITEADEQEDHVGRKFHRSYIVWKEDGVVFGGWIVSYTGAGALEMYEDESGDYFDVKQTFYPQHIKPLAVKERLIVETTYMIPMRNSDNPLPIAWVTYQNEQHL